MAVGLKAPARILPVPGVRLAARCAGIYRRTRPDLCLMELAPGTVASAVFTTNAFCAAPVRVARTHLQAAQPRYCLVNAGNANAGTGERGMQDARETCRLVSEAGGCSVEEVLPFSTGVIGEFLPLDAFRNSIPALHSDLREDGWMSCARAIMTTDTVPKGTSRRLELEDASVTVSGIAKGAGMIHPRLATMLAFAATDAAVSPPLLQRMIREAADASFHRVTIDGDTSTNDAFLLLATGKAGGLPLDSDSDPRYEMLLRAVREVCIELARALVRDGEGATKFITVTVTGGADEKECLDVARSVSVSPLVKTAFFASDPNWGRILAAVGRTGLQGLEVDRISVTLGGVPIVEAGGRAPEYTEEAGRRVMSREEIEVEIRLGRGQARASLWTCDLSEEYVRINAEYRT